MKRSTKVESAMDAIIQSNARYVANDRGIDGLSGPPSNTPAATPKRAAKRPRAKRTGKTPATAPDAFTGRVGPILDVTSMDALVAITSPRDGTNKVFSIVTQPADASFCPGQRIVALVGGIGRPTSFAFVDAFGVHVWGRFKSDTGKRSVCEWYADMLERPSVYAAKGYVYDVTM